MNLKGEMANSFLWEEVVNLMALIDHHEDGGDDEEHEKDSDWCNDYHDADQ